MQDGSRAFTEEYIQSSSAGTSRLNLAQVPDPLGRKGKRPPFTAIETEVNSAILSGSNGDKPLAQVLHLQPETLDTFLDSPQAVLSDHRLTPHS